MDVGSRRRSKGKEYKKLETVLCDGLAGARQCPQEVQLTGTLPGTQFASASAVLKTHKNK
jgi:hypothetical protein